MPHCCMWQAATTAIAHLKLVWFGGQDQSHQMASKPPPERSRKCWPTNTREFACPATRREALDIAAFPLRVHVSVCVCWSGLCGTWPTSMWCDRIRSLLVAQRRLLIDATATCRMQHAVNKKRKSIVRTKTAANALSQLGVTPVHRQHAPCHMPHPACRMPAPSRPSTVCQVDRQIGNGWHCINLSINVAINIKSSPLAYSLCTLISHKCSACGKGGDAVLCATCFSLLWSLSRIVIAAGQIYDMSFLKVSIDLFLFSLNLRQFRNSRVQREAHPMPHTFVWLLLQQSCVYRAEQRRQFPGNLRSLLGNNHFARFQLIIPIEQLKIEKISQRNFWL